MNQNIRVRTDGAPTEKLLRSALSIKIMPAAVPAAADQVVNQEQPKVAILLCSYYGQRYLAEQLDSFAAQSYSNWEVWVSDDGSADSTRAILEEYRQKWPAGRLTIFTGPVKGFAANFISLSCKVDSGADFYAYSDQDDIWEAGKLERAVNLLKTVSDTVPALYCSRTRLVDANNNPIGLSPLFPRPPGFSNALVQSIGGGNTMVFNDGARKLLCEAGEDLSVISHDWWLYMVVTGCGGQVLYDRLPTTRYRQHDHNLVGVNNTWPARFTRARMLWQGYFRKYNEANITAIRTLEHRLTPENRKILDCFAKARQMRLIPRLIYLKRSGIYRQKLLGNLGLIVAAIFGKI
ncbi:glycosyltransferase family 2 protein [Nitrosomonas sp. HPC101]|uniref:glycosyltransferase family 2 protein n=1 Tax=Nitrosomonas sp. HPC101 TaxID=1658667 RepID=UPI001F03B1A3|nr:glycosyltransferase family 2 protein [Nitrosomonas sp. HPC101]